MAGDQVPPSTAYEQRVWKAVQPGWKSLHGGFHEQGISIEEHDFRIHDPLNWARSFHPDSLEICLNLSGSGSVEWGSRSLRFLPNTMGYYVVGAGPLTAWRAPGERHRFVTIELSRAFLRLHLAGCEKDLQGAVRAILEGTRCSSAVADLQRMSLDQQLLVRSLRRPPVPRLALPLWYQSKTLELLTQLLFSPQVPADMFCSRHKRTSWDRVESVITLLRNQLDEPPSLEELGREAGCSAFYLSRLFSEQMGVTIPQYLRRLRMERAAELLVTGDYNVTEAAMEVGYNSLSHFTKAFRETMGCCPGLYPHGRIPSPKLR